MSFSLGSRYFDVKKIPFSSLICDLSLGTSYLQKTFVQEDRITAFAPAPAGHGSICVSKYFFVPGYGPHKDCL